MKTIEQVTGGYIVTGNGERRVYKTLDEVFEDLLMHFEGRASSFYDKLFGRVIVQRDPTEK